MNSHNWVSSVPAQDVQKILELKKSNNLVPLPGVISASSAFPLVPCSPPLLSTTGILKGNVTDRGEEGRDV